MSEEPVLVSHDGPVSTITINREKSLNALDRATLEALRRVLDALASRSELRCAILTGAGDRAFVAGADISAMVGMGIEEGRAFADLGDETFAAVEALSVPVIAAVNGFALGGGCELALACDFILASNKAKFGQPEVKLGVIPGFGGTQRLPRRIGLGLARELIYTGRTLGAEDALRIGLVNAVVPREELLPLANKTAREIAAMGPVAVAAAKRVMLDGASVGLPAAVELEALAFADLFGTEDKREGMTAFLEKRAASFKNS